MNNDSDNKDFEEWQNGDESNNPNNWKNGFYYYGNMNPDNFRKMWEQIYKNPQDPTEGLKDYLNIDDMFNDFKEVHGVRKPKNNKNKNPIGKKVTILSQEDYFKLIEIRGYLAITEQYAHVKALDKLLNQIIITPKE